MKYLVFMLMICNLLHAEDKVEYVLYTKANCGPCERLKVAVAQIGLKTVEGILNKNDGITQVPVIVILVNGIEQKRIVGFTTKEKLEADLLIEHCVPKKVEELPKLEILYRPAPVLCKTG